MFVGDPRLWYGYHLAVLFPRYWLAYPIFVCSASAEKIFLEYVAPFPSTTAEKDRWVDRLLNITKYLDSTSMMKLRKFSRIGVK
jgi:hypothetical protein